METRQADDAGGRTGRAVVGASLLLAACLSRVASAAGPNDVPARYQGSWVPGQAACESSPVRVTIGADRLTLVNGNDKQALGGIEMAGPGYFAHDYRGIMAVLLTEFSGDQPATVTFNPREKRGTAQVDFAPVMPGKGTAQLAAYNAHISKLDLGRRFPVDKVLLKKCPGAVGGTKR